MSNLLFSDLLLSIGQSKSLAQSRLSVGGWVVKHRARDVYTTLRTFNATIQTNRMKISFRQMALWGGGVFH